MPLCRGGVASIVIAVAKHFVYHDGERLYPIAKHARISEP
jgi:hypothetical protein